MQLSLHSIAYPVTSLGPGRRLALWVAGCPLRCPGCITPQLWDAGAGQSLPVEDVLARLLAIDYEFDGITLTGGEPFEQAQALAWLLAALADERPHWNTLCFSGYCMRELQNKLPQANDLLARLDVLIAGRYVRKRQDPRALVASTNQRVHYLSERSAALRPALDALDPEAADLALADNGEKLLIGVLPPAPRARIHAAIGVQDEQPENRDGGIY